jgi:hypothetical protein
MIEARLRGGILIGTAPPIIRHVVVVTWGRADLRAIAVATGRGRIAAFSREESGASP